MSVDTNPFRSPAESRRSTRSRRRRHLAGTGALALVGAVLAACGGGSDGAASGRDDLVVAIHLDPVCVDPAQASLLVSNNITRQVVDSLVDQDPKTGEFHPWLASSWEVDDKATSFTFTLREGVTFSDGSALDAAAVRDSIQAVVDLGPKSVLGLSALAGFKAVEAVDATTVRVDFERPRADFLAAAASPTLGILAPSTLKAAPEDRCAGKGVSGTGPFVIDSYAPNQSTKLSRREGYDWASELAAHKGDAHLKAVTYQVSSESSVRVGSLESDQVQLSFSVPPQDEPRIDGGKLQLLSRVNPGVVNSLSPTIEGNPILEDEAVRKAIQLSIDREEIAKTVLTPEYGVASNVLAETTPGWTDGSESMPFDPEEAATLLDEAGWKEGPDGIREKGGKPLQLTVGYYENKAPIEYLQQQVRKVGIDLQLKELTAAQYVQEYPTGKYDLIEASLTRTDPSVLATTFDARSTRLPIVGESNPVQQTLMPMFDELNSTTDLAQRTEIATEVQKTLLENGFIFPVSQQTQVVGARADLEGLRFDASSRVVLYDAEFKG